MKKQDSVPEIREQIKSITESLLDLAKARQSLSEKLAHVKEMGGTPIEDLIVESALIASIEKYAKKIGLDTNLATNITRELIESSKSVQRRTIFTPRIKKHLSYYGVKEVGIVGAGRMGGWFSKYFSPLVEKVFVFDSDRKFGVKRSIELGCRFSGSLRDISRTDLVLVAVPIGETASITKKLLELRSKRIVEISSLKEGVLKEIGSQSTFYSIHPLFGSYAAPFASNCLIDVSPGRDGFVKGLFPHFKIEHLGAEAHDRLMSILLTLPHLFALSFAGVVLERRSLLRGLSSPSFTDMLRIANKTLSENPRVYYEIESMNRHGRKTLKKTFETFEKLNAFYLSDDYQRFEKFFLDARRKLRKLRSQGSLEFQL